MTVAATTRRPENCFAGSPLFRHLKPARRLEPATGTKAACIFLSVARLRDCASDPVASALVNVRQSLQLIDRLFAEGIYVLYLSSNQVFDGERPTVPADRSTLSDQRIRDDRKWSRGCYSKANGKWCANCDLAAVKSVGAEFSTDRKLDPLTCERGAHRGLLLT